MLSLAHERGRKKWQIDKTEESQESTYSKSREKHAPAARVQSTLLSCPRHSPACFMTEQSTVLDFLFVKERRVKGNQKRAVEPTSVGWNFIAFLSHENYA